MEVTVRNGEPWPGPHSQGEGGEAHWRHMTVTGRTAVECGAIKLPVRQWCCTEWRCQELVGNYDADGRKARVQSSVHLHPRESQVSLYVSFTLRSSCICVHLLWVTVCPNTHLQAEAMIRNIRTEASLHTCVCVHDWVLTCTGTACDQMLTCRLWHHFVDAGTQWQGREVTEEIQCWLQNSSAGNQVLDNHAVFLCRHNYVCAVMQLGEERKIKS
jgi:hypothetical protein